MKHNFNPKSISTGLFNVADQHDDLDKVKDALRILNYLVIESGQFRVLVQSKDKRKIKSRNPQFSFRKIISSFSK